MTMCWVMRRNVIVDQTANLFHREKTYAQFGRPLTIVSSTYISVPSLNVAMATPRRSTWPVIVAMSPTLIGEHTPYLFCHDLSIRSELVTTTFNPYVSTDAVIPLAKLRCDLEERRTAHCTLTRVLGTPDRADSRLIQRYSFNYFVRRL